MQLIYILATFYSITFYFNFTYSHLGQHLLYTHFFVNDLSEDGLHGPKHAGCAIVWVNTLLIFLCLDYLYFFPTVSFVQ